MIINFYSFSTPIVVDAFSTTLIGLTVSTITTIPILSNSNQTVTL